MSRPNFLDDWWYCVLVGQGAIPIGGRAQAVAEAVRGCPAEAARGPCSMLAYQSWTSQCAVGHGEGRLGRDAEQLAAVAATSPMVVLRPVPMLNDSP